MTRRASSGLIAFLISSLIVWRIWPGLLIDFNTDDLANLHGAWSTPWPRLLGANLVPFTSVFRPAGSLWYRTMYTVFGLDPLPFRIMAFSFLLANSFLLFRLGRLLSGKAEIGILAAVLAGFHGRLHDVYKEGGNVYDILAGTFFLAALVYYVGIRQRGQQLRSPGQWIIFYLLTVAAINAKEISATLPILLLVYEVIYQRPRGWRSVIVSGRGVSLASLIVACGIWAKLGAGSPMHQHPGYTPEISVRRYFENSRSQVTALLYMNEPALNTTKTVLIWAALFAAAAISRRPHLWFAACFAFVSPLPLQFLSPRGFSMMYVPFLGYCLWLSGLLVECRDYIRSPRSGHPSAAERVLLVTAAAVVFLVVIPGLDSASSLDGVWPESAKVHAMHRQLVAAPPKVPRGGRILFLNSRWGPDSVEPYFLLRLFYKDHDLAVHQRAAKGSSFDLVIDDTGGQLRSVTD